MNNLEQIVCQYYKDKNGKPMSYHIRRRHQISPKNYQIQLDGIPDEYRGIEVIEPIGLYRVENADEITEDSYWVRDDGNVFFHESRACQNVMLDYYSIGLPVVGAGRIYTLLDEEGNVIETLEDILEKGKTVIEALKTMSDVIVAINDLKVSTHEAIKVISTLDETIDKGYELLAKLNAIDYIQTQELNSYVINVKHLPHSFNLESLKMNGDDESDIFQKILDYCSKNFNNMKLIIPNGEIRISKTINWDISKIQIECYGTIYNSSKDNIYTFNCFSSNQTQEGLYTQNTMVNKGMKIKGINEKPNFYTKGLLFDNIKGSSVGSSRITFQNCSFYGFEEALTFKDNAYAISFNQCSVFDSYKVMNILNGNDSGENISFNNCFLFNSSILIECNNSGATVYFRGCSLDYITEHYVICNNGYIYINNSFIESNGNWFKEKNMFILKECIEGKISIDGNYIFMTSVDDKEDVMACPFLNENKLETHIWQPYCIEVTNNNIKGLKCKNKQLSNNDGLVIIKNNTFKDGDEIGCLNNVFSNLVIDGYMPFNRIEMHYDLDYGSGIKATSETDGNINFLCLQKISEENTYATFIFKKPNTKYIGIGLDFMSSIDLNNTIAINGFKRKSNGVLGNCITIDTEYGVKTFKDGYRQYVYKKKPLLIKYDVFEYLGVTIDFKDVPLNEKIFIKKIQVNEL